ncbi:MAG: hypothetical protein ACC656_09500, partial [Candidatus Heimdallarchaeota archaeon]
MANPFEKLPENYPVDFIINNFDFEKVHRYMIYGNWKWARINGVPSVKELKYCAKQLLEELRNRDNETWSIGTGGFQAIKRNNKLQRRYNGNYFNVL